MELGKDSFWVLADALNHNDLDNDESDRAKVLWEATAYAAMGSCLLILENSLKMSIVKSEPLFLPELYVGKIESKNHQRALNMVSLALKRDWIIPSEYDYINDIKLGSR